VNKERTLKAMREIAESEISPDIDLWPQLERQLVSERHAPPRSFTRSAPRLGWIMAIVTVLFLFGAVAYATSPAGRALLGLDPALEQVDLAGLGRALDLKQTKMGSSVTLHWAYADANRIAIVYEIAGANGRRYDLRELALKDSGGNVFPGMLGMGVRGESDLVDIVLPPGVSGYIYSFDASSISGTPQTLNLQLSLSIEAFELPEEAQATVSVLESEDGKATVVELEPLQEGAREVVGPFIFDFSVPFVPGRVAEPHTTVVDEGTPVTLEKVVVTPSETVALICIDAPDQAGYDEWLPISEIAVTGEQREAMAGSHIRLDDRCTLSRYWLPLSSSAREWTLTVTEVVGFKRSGPEQMRIEGPWIFEFEAP
jgi:hypothetical protein